MPKSPKRQLTDTVVMVSPNHFGFNPQTANSNPFQHKLNDSELSVQKKALEEFRNMVDILKKEGVNVLILPSREEVMTPDAIFPNNWFSHHQDGKLIVYPMLAPNRRAERQTEKLRELLDQANVPVSEIVDLSQDERDGNFLEGTGSLVLDREHNHVFAMESPRTTKKEFDKWCSLMGYEGIFFRAYDAESFPIYHTNVTMNLGRDFAIVCLASIKDKTERREVESQLKNLEKEIISITIEQMYKFCGNVLQVLSKSGESKIIMSKSAYDGFTSIQKGRLEKFGQIIAVEIPTIETVGGGSARCMMAEVFHA
ncbi:amidinotransferase [Candidatus Daviesbacteria bacterium]|nr:amidinotransferase [Candidatus Daviesbacteria bacterium]